MEEKRRNKVKSAIEIGIQIQEMRVWMKAMPKTGTRLPADNSEIRSENEM
jgi:hypothetical protein